MIYIKRKETAKGLRYYREDIRQDRSFPIARVEAERLLANGEAELVDYFCTSNDIAAYGEAQRAKSEDKHKEAIKNVVSLAEVKKRKEAEKEIDRAKEQFLNEILPNLTQESLLRLGDAALYGDKETYKAEIMRAIMEACVRSEHG